MLCRRFRSKLILGGAAVLVFGGFLLQASYLSDITCSNARSIQYLDSVCSNYMKGIITGSLCIPLCHTKEIKFKQCLGHGVKLHVLEAEWKGNAIVLKTTTFLEGILPMWVTDVRDNFTVTTKYFVHHVERNIYYTQTGGINTTRISDVAWNIVRECDVGGDGILTYWEATTCWQLVTTDEYIFYSLLHNNSAILDVYGTCGNIYAVQYAAAEPFLGFQTSLSDGRSWEFRTKLALALLNMVKALEDTPYGTLYLCDVQEPNFGVVKSEDGALIAKTIDLDIAMFKKAILSQLQHERNVPCKVDGDCFLVHCGSKCSQERRKCAGVLTSSNFVTICDRILKQRHRIHPALLRNPPDNIKERLHNLLEKCSQYGYFHVDINLLNQLKQLLLLHHL